MLWIWAAPGAELVHHTADKGGLAPGAAAQAEAAASSPGLRAVLEPSWPRRRTARASTTSVQADNQVLCSETKSKTPLSQGCAVGIPEPAEHRGSPRDATGTAHVHTRAP